MSDDGSTFLPPFPDSAEPLSEPPAPPLSTPCAPPAPAVSSPTAVPSTPAVPQPSVRYAGFWRRFWAVLLDGLLLFAAGIAADSLMRAAAGVSITPIWKESSGGTPPYNCMETCVGILIGWGYAASLESSEKQATLGKMALRIRVSDLAGRRISFARATGRHFAQIFDVLTLFVGYAMAGFTRRKQALHDKIAGTLVVRA